MHTALVLYLVVAMLDWVPLATQQAAHESLRSAGYRYHEIAESVARVVEDPDEEPLYNSRAETGLILLGIASYVSDLSKDAQEGRCWNLPTHCDSGQAFGLWQIKPERGIVLMRDGFLIVPLDSTEWAGDALHGPEIGQSVALSARVELHMVRHYLHTVGHLGYATGEATNGPAARAWLARGRSYYFRHPFDEEQSVATVTP